MGRFPLSEREGIGGRRNSTGTKPTRTQLNVFPPEISNSVHKAKGTEALTTSKLLAKELVDCVRVGVYPQDTGLARGKATDDASLKLFGEPGMDCSTGGPTGLRSISNEYRILGS
eukprot:1241742-Rhodomonas_salina.1